MATVGAVRMAILYKMLVLVLGLSSCTVKAVLAEDRKIEVLVVSTKPALELGMLQHSADTVGLPLKIRGMGNEKLQAWGVGLGEKLKYQWDFAKKAILNDLKIKAIKALSGSTTLSKNSDPETIMLVLDAFDVILDGTEPQILEKYDRLRKENPGCAIFFNGEVYCYHGNCPGKGGRVTKEDEKYRFMNSGAMIGKASDIAAIFEGYDPLSYVEDQYYWSVQWIMDHTVGKHKGNGRICLDTKGVLYQSMARVEAGVEIPKTSIISSTTMVTSEFEYNTVTPESEIIIHPLNPIGQRFTRKDTGEKPLILHFNAGKRGFYEAFQHLYGYRVLQAMLGPDSVRCGAKLPLPHTGEDLQIWDYVKGRAAGIWESNRYDPNGVWNLNSNSSKQSGRLSEKGETRFLTSGGSLAERHTRLMEMEKRLENVESKLESERKRRLEEEKHDFNEDIRKELEEQEKKDQDEEKREKLMFRGSNKEKNQHDDREEKDEKDALNEKDPLNEEKEEEKQKHYHTSSKLYKLPLKKEENSTSSTNNILGWLVWVFVQVLAITEWIFHSVMGMVPSLISPFSYYPLDAVMDDDLTPQQEYESIPSHLELGGAAFHAVRQFTLLGILPFLLICLHRFKENVLFYYMNSKLEEEKARDVFLKNMKTLILSEKNTPVEEKSMFCYVCHCCRKCLFCCCPSSRSTTDELAYLESENGGAGSGKVTRKTTTRCSKRRRSPPFLKNSFARRGKCCSFILCALLGAYVYSSFTIMNVLYYEFLNVYPESMQWSKDFINLFPNEIRHTETFQWIQNFLFETLALERFVLSVSGFIAWFSTVEYAAQYCVPITCTKFGLWLDYICRGNDGSSIGEDFFQEYEPIDKLDNIEMVSIGNGVSVISTADGNSISLSNGPLSDGTAVSNGTSPLPKKIGKEALE